MAYYSSRYFAKRHFAPRYFVNGVISAVKNFVCQIGSSISTSMPDLPIGRMVTATIGTAVQTTIASMAVGRLFAATIGISVQTAAANFAAITRIIRSRSVSVLNRVFSIRKR